MNQKPEPAWSQYLKYGSKLYSEKDYPAAIEAFKKSITIKENWNAYQGLGWALYDTESYEEAIEALEKSASIEENCNTYQRLGSALFLTKNYSAAIEAFKKAIAIEENWITYQGLGWVLYYEENYPAAIEAFINSIALEENWNTYQGLGTALFHTNNYSAAIEAFNKSIALEENWDTYGGLGSALFRTKNYSEAIEAFNKSISLQENSDAFRGLGLAFFHTKSYRKALNAIFNSCNISHSKEAKDDFCRIYIQESLESYNTHNNCMPKDFFKYDASDNAKMANIFLKDYILQCSKNFKIDTLLLRYTSLPLKAGNKASIALTEDKLIDSLKETNTRKGADLPEICEFHRYIFGASHSKLHFISPNTTIIKCGAGTMFSIGNHKSRTKHFQKINSAICSINPKKSILIFEFGEIDIRNHIFKISNKKSQSIYNTADAAISRYLEFIESIRKKGFHIMIAGPHCGGGEIPSIASAVERNDLCAYINDALYLECHRHGFYFFTLFDKVVSQKTLKEIPGFYRDSFHLCLPPSKIGYALNDLLNKRIYRELSEVRSQYKFLQQEQVHAQCTLVLSDVPDWHTGKRFETDKEMSPQNKLLKKGQYIMLIELPFLIHPKEIKLTFEHPTIKIKTAIQGVLESWDNSKPTGIDNIIHAYEKHSDGAFKKNSISHWFGPDYSKEEMCRFLIVRISTITHENRLAKVSIKRWVGQY